MENKVTPVEGHSKWLLDLAPYIEERAGPEKEYLGNFCARLRNWNEDEVASGVGWNEWSAVLAHKLNSIAISILTLDNCGKTKMLMEELDKLLVKKLRPATDNQREVIFYCRNVLKWRHAGGMDGDATAKRLNAKWEALMNEGDEVRATVAFLKGKLALELGLELERVQTFYLEAIELDSECLAWYNHAYLVARDIRRGGEGGPSKMEQDLAETAYKICYGQDVIAAANYAIMCKEVWMEKKEHFWGDDQEMYYKCVQYLENAVRFAEGDWLMKVRIHLAEFLYFGKGTPKDELRGLGMFMALEREYPRSLSVVHMVGKRYFEEGNFRQARESYERALRLNPGDVSCIMDYIELLNLRNGVGEKNEILRILRRALSPKYRGLDEDNAKLQRQLDLVMKEIEDVDGDSGEGGEDGN